MAAPQIELEVAEDSIAAAHRAAARIATAGVRAIAGRGRFTLALSGGSTSPAMFDALAAAALDWSRVSVFQVDERVTARGSAERNLTAIEASFGKLSGIKIHAMPVDDDDLSEAARRYESILQHTAGTPPIPDLIHLGLGDDGHTASLFAGDAPDLSDPQEVRITAPRHGFRRMTLTLPVINRARVRVWLVCGANKSAVAGRLLKHDPQIPAGRVNSDDSWLITDFHPR